MNTEIDTNIASEDIHGQIEHHPVENQSPSTALPVLQKILADLDALTREKPGNAGDSAGNSPGNSREIAGNPTENPVPLPKNHSTLHSLPPADKLFVLDLLDSNKLEDVKRKLSLPRPLGLAIHVSTSALQRFHYNPRPAQVVEDHDIAVEQAETILEIAAETDLDFIQAAKHLLKVRLLKTSISPTAQTAEIRDLFRILDRLRAMDLAERRLHLAEQKNSQPPTNVPS